MRKFSSHYFIGFIIFLFLILLGVFVIDDYGVAWDTEVQRETGRISYDYIFHGKNFFFTYYDRGYGVVFELPLLLIEKKLELNDHRSIYLMRHAVTHLLYLIAGLCCFLLLFKLYKNLLVSSIGFFFAIFSPRLYPHSFMNSKDVPFYSLFMIALYFAVRALEKYRIIDFILLGIACAMLVNLRTVGLIVVVATVFYMLIVSIKDILQKNQAYKRHLVLLSAFLLSFGASFVLITPLLWEDTLSNFLYIFKEGANNDRFDTNVLFMGKYMRSSDTHWYYPLVYFFSANPLLPLLLGVFGIGVVFLKFIKRPLNLFDSLPFKSNLLFLICYTAPLVAVVIFKPNLSDGWRQLYFLYAPFVLIASYGLFTLLETKLRQIIFVALLVGISFNIHFMATSHPFQFGFFNAFTSKEPEHIRKSYEFDYYSLSYRKAIEYILDKDKSDHIPIFVVGRGPKSNGYILPAEDRKRIEFVSDYSYAKYYVGNYRWNHMGYPMFKGKKFIDIKLGNNTMTSVFKLF